MSYVHEKIAEWKTFPEGTLGKDIATCLESHGLRLVPRYESHDLKHVLLDFKMTPVDEIRMQAFMLGNGNYSPASFVIFIFGALFLPDLWKTFYRDFMNGRHTQPIKNWTIEEYAFCQTTTLREIILNSSKQPEQKYGRFSLPLFGSYAAIILGTIGMMYCLPFLFSSSVTDLVGAGFPFVGGAIIASAGLLSLSNLRKFKMDNGFHPVIATVDRTIA